MVLPTASATAPPEPPSPMMAATSGTSMSRQVAIAAAIAAAWPRASASTPGSAPAVVDKGQHRQAEAVGEPHQPARLAVALGSRHAEIARDPGLGVGAFLGAENQHAAPAKPANAADDGTVLGKGAVAGERHEFGDQAADKIESVRPLGVARHLHLLPWGQPGIGLAQEPRGACFEPPDLVGDVEVTGGRQMAQLLDFPVEFADRSFEIEKMAHHLRRASGCAEKTSRRSRSERT